MYTRPGAEMRDFVFDARIAVAQGFEHRPQSVFIKGFEESVDRQRSANEVWTDSFSGIRCQCVWQAGVRNVRGCCHLIVSVGRG